MRPGNGDAKIALSRITDYVRVDVKAIIKRGNTHLGRLVHPSIVRIRKL